MHYFRSASTSFPMFVDSLIPFTFSLPAGTISWVWGLGAGEFFSLHIGFFYILFLSWSSVGACVFREDSCDLPILRLLWTCWYSNPTLFRLFRCNKYGGRFLSGFYFLFPSVILFYLSVAFLFSFPMYMYTVPLSDIKRSFYQLGATPAEHNIILLNLLRRRRK